MRDYNEYHKSYVNLLRKCLNEGKHVGDTISLTGEQFRVPIYGNRVPLPQIRRINVKAAIGELKCFLKGTCNYKDFEKEGATFWKADLEKSSWADNPHKSGEFDLGKIYGYQWKHGFKHDQIAKLLRRMEEKPESRRHVLITYNPGHEAEACLPPCYISHQFLIRNGSLDLIVNQRSADLCIGLPYDIVSFFTLAKLFANELGLSTGELIINFGDAHIYESHVHKLLELLDVDVKALQQAETLILDTDASPLSFSEGDYTVYTEFNFAPICRFQFEAQPAEVYR